uniref:MARVEL domain-containing protein n=1 Tax=Theileria parva TaxID=5875 RepID=Q4N3Y7_THEPA|eukprot:XP_765419.1 hypothetical protein [Theileria parva strain Muguga]
MLILKSFKRPKGGGPCPLIQNPVKKWLKYLSIFHIILLVMTCVSISFPFIHDLHCSILFNSLANLIASAICSTLMASYYIFVSNKDLGTENEWAITAIITITVVIIDISISGWGIYTFTNSSFKIYKALHDEFQVEPDCLQTKARVFYISGFIVICLHIFVAGTGLATAHTDLSS